MSDNTEQQITSNMLLSLEQTPAPHLKTLLTSLITHLHAFMIFIVVIGGMGTIEGPIVGVALFFLLREYLADFGEWSLILLGAVAVLLLLAPEGLWGLIQRRLRIEIFPVRRRLAASSAPFPNEDAAESRALSV